MFIVATKREDKLLKCSADWHRSVLFGCSFGGEYSLLVLSVNILKYVCCQMVMA